MEKELPGWTLSELAVLLDAELDGPADKRILRAGSSDSRDSDAMGFAESEAYMANVRSSGLGAVLVPKGTDAGGMPMLFVASPRAAFGKFLALCQRPLPIAPGIHPQAVVSPEATIDPTAQIGAFVVVERGARIDANVRIYPFSYIGENCQIGEGSVVLPHSVLVQDVMLGKNCIIQPGAILGADGFGFSWDGRKRMKVPQVGRVTLGDDVEVGANATIDRATAGATSVGSGTKMDNLVHLGHNVTVGSDSVIAGLVGVSGSSKIGDRCVLAGQVALSDHVTVGSDIILAGRTGVTSDLTTPGTYFGFPARPLREAMRSLVLTTRLAEIFSRVRNLERRANEPERQP